MPIKIYIFFLHCIFYYQYTLVNARAMIGLNVRQAKEKEYPFIVSIVKIDYHLCTGTLFTKQDVITVGHCLKHEKLDNIKIIVGSISLKNGFKYSPLWWITYNEWSYKKQLSIQFQIDDIAIIRLSEKVSENVKPAILVTATNPEFYGLDVSVAGWGMSNSGLTNSIMETVALKILSNSECEDRARKVVGHKLTMDSGIICTANDPFALLQRGDSGGPLLYKDKVIAINIGTAPLPNLDVHPNKINIHFNIYYYYNFILDVRNNF